MGSSLLPVANFLLSGEKVRRHFLAHHADLLSAEYWNAVKARVARGEVADVFPYPEALRFAHRFGPPNGGRA